MIRHLDEQRVPRRAGVDVNVIQSQPIADHGSAFVRNPGDRSRPIPRDARLVPRGVLAYHERHVQIGGRTEPVVTLSPPGWIRVADRSNVDRLDEFDRFCECQH